MQIEKRNADGSLKIPSFPASSIVSSIELAESQRFREDVMQTVDRLTLLFP